MPNQSKKTKMVTVRLPVELFEAINKRLNGQIMNPETRSQFICRILAYDLLRKR